MAPEERARGFAQRCYPRGRSPGDQIAEVVDDDVGTCSPQRLLLVTIVGRRRPIHAHHQREPTSPPGDDTSNGILDNSGTSRRDRELACRLEVAVRRWFSGQVPASADDTEPAWV